MVMRNLILALALILFSATHATAQTDITAPTDPIVIVDGANDGDGSSGPPPGNEDVENAINNTGQKYLNFLDLGSGFAVTPDFGASIVTGIRLYTANDSEPRDPASYLLEGSNSGVGGPYTTISSGALALPSGRNPGGNTVTIPDLTANFQELNFANTTSYTTYRLTFPTLKDAANANSMQIGEVELLGVAAPPPPPAPPEAIPALGGMGLVLLVLLLPLTVLRQRYRR